uniref:LY6/PLAUR domain containing 1 n=1 Tax=Cyprinus carpio TaxID=7962 RepID=A0A8C1LB21_CYPCA
MQRCVTLLVIVLTAGMSAALQIQCYQCEDVRQDDCTSPEFIVNCTVNVQDMCQKEELVMEDGIHYRKSCASSGACLIASSGYQQFCTGKLNSVCITCCNTALCNGPRHKRRAASHACAAPSISHYITSLLGLMLLYLCLH